jgi:putative sterol carrier protein
MAIKYASEEWVQAAREAINKSQAYKEAAKKWEGDMYFIVEPEGGLKEKIFMYFDLWHGECRAASVVTDESAKTPAYRFWAPVGVWRQILEKKVDAVQAMMTGKLSLKGDMAQIMKMPKAASELVNSMLQFETEFPW